ncbi:MAG: transposase [Syntrophaceticus sp.]|nr:transposase [Syntrophaceticus sp.]
MVRGINRQNIFHNKEYYSKYLNILRQVASDGGHHILGYCLMRNHVHLLIDTGESGISEIMKRLGIRYAQWYNRKKERCGHVFQDRFKSETVETERYLLTVIRYIHQNPVKAGIVANAEDYPWSSCRSYYRESDFLPGLTHTQPILSLFADRTTKAVPLFRHYMEEPNDDQCLEDIEPKRVTDTLASELIKKALQGHKVVILHEMPELERNMILRKLKEEDGLGIRQIMRLTGLKYWSVYKACKQ